MFGKRGLSDVVSTVLIILLVVAAVAGLWLLVKPLLDSGDSGIQRAQVCITNSVEVSSCRNVPASNRTDVNLERTSADSDVIVSQVNVIVIYGDGTANSTVLVNASLNGLGTMDSTNVSGTKVAKSAKAVAKYILSSGDTTECESPVKNCI
ncbi:MAG: hypothetical protein AABX11_07865 [Nanoarchaeota archaeon]